eukprot:4544335-Amphidinium_carterae.1
MSMPPPVNNVAVDGVAREPTALLCYQCESHYASATLFSMQCQCDSASGPRHLQWAQAAMNEDVTFKPCQQHVPAMQVAQTHSSNP